MTRSLRDRDLSRARELVLEHGRNATAYQILNPGFQRWFSSAGDAVVGHVTYGRCCVVAGKPVCAAERLREVLAELAGAMADRRICFFAAGAELEQPLGELGETHRLLLGAQPVWRPSSWPGIVARKPSLRAQLHRATNKDVSIERWDAGRSSGRAELGGVLAEWLATRGLPALHFLVETDTLDRLDDRRVFVARKPDQSEAERVVGFLVASPIAARHGWLVEQIVRGTKAPNGTTELLLDAAMDAFLGAGDELVTLGLAPLSRRAPVNERAPAARVRWALQVVRELGRRFYDFDGLDAYKAKFVPDAWEPLYAFSHEPIGLRTLWAFAGAFGGTSPPRLMVQGLRRRLERALSPR